MRSLATGTVLLELACGPALAQQQCPPSMPYRMCVVDQQALPRGSSPITCAADGIVPNQRCWCPNSTSPAARPYPGRIQCLMRNPR